VIVGTREAATRIASGIHSYLRDFLVDIHVATSDTAKSKSVVVFVPANKATKESEMRQPILLDDDVSRINFVKQATYLGHIIAEDLSDDHHLRTRMAKASQVFGALRQHLFGNKQVWREVKTRVLLTMVLPTMLDGAENCTISHTIMREMESLYHRLIRSCLRITPYTQRKYKLTSETLLHRMKLQPLHHYVDLKVLQYAGHVQRMAPARLPKLITTSRPLGPQRRGRPAKSWEASVAESIKRKGIKNEWRKLAEDKNTWKQLIRKKSNNTSARVRPHRKTCRYPETWNARPNCLLGKYVETRFGTKWYVGKIISTDIDKDTNDQIWRVLYDDNDEADYSGTELQKILCDDIENSVPE
jgi:hypothetical protein